jgi:hypothetical protein
LSIEEKLLKKPEDEYGKNYQAHLLDIYKLYVEMADRISSRRQSVNSFFLTVNTAIIAIVGYVQLVIEKSTEFYWIVNMAGIVLCFLWYRLIRSYKDLTSGKFEVIYAIEKHLPISPYDAEWEVLCRGKDPKLYLLSSKIEMIVPWVFLALHFVVFLRALP